MDVSEIRVDLRVILITSLIVVAAVVFFYLRRDNNSEAAPLAVDRDERNRRRETAALRAEQRLAKQAAENTPSRDIAQAPKKTAIRPAARRQQTQSSSAPPKKKVQISDSDDQKPDQEQRKSLPEQGEQGQQQQVEQLLSSVATKSSISIDAGQKTTVHKLPDDSITVNIVLKSDSSGNSSGRQTPMPLAVKRSTTVADLLDDISKETSIDLSSLRVLFRGKIVKSTKDQSCQDLGLIEGASLQVIATLTRSIAINLILTSSGGIRQRLTIPNCITATELRDRISTVTGIPLAELKLIFGGQVIQQRQHKGLFVVRDYGLMDDCALHVVGKPQSDLDSAIRLIGSRSSGNLCHEAAARGDLEFLRQAHLNGQTKLLSAPDSNSWTILHEAARGGHLDVVKYLVCDLGLDVTMRTNQGLTALHLAHEHHGSDSALVQWMSEHCN